MRLPILCILIPTVLTAASVKVERTDNQIAVTIDGKPFTTYYFDPQVAKPYLMPLQTASGAVLTRPFPVKNDASMGNAKESSFEPHQRPLYFAHGDLDGLDFWGEAAFARYYNDHAHQAYGHRVLKAIEEAQSSGDVGTIRARYTLNDPNNRVIGEETESFTFQGTGRTRTIDCRFVLYASAGPLVFGDTKEGTFGIRLGRELSAPLGRMRNSNGAEGEKAIWGETADWVAYDGIVDGKRVGIAVFDSPASFRHPTTWHARAYGLLAANPFGAREFTRDENKDGSWTVAEGKSITFRYGVLIFEGDFPVSEISKAYAEYAAKK